MEEQNLNNVMENMLGQIFSNAETKTIFNELLSNIKENDFDANQLLKSAIKLAESDQFKNIVLNNEDQLTEAMGNGEQINNVIHNLTQSKVLNDFVKDK